MALYATRTTAHRALITTAAAIRAHACTRPGRVAAGAVSTIADSAHCRVALRVPAATAGAPLRGSGALSFVGLLLDEQHAALGAPEQRAVGTRGDHPSSSSSARMPLNRGV